MQLSPPPYPPPSLPPKRRLNEASCNDDSEKMIAHNVAAEALMRTYGVNPHIWHIVVLHASIAERGDFFLVTSSRVISPASENVAAPWTSP